MRKGEREVWESKLAACIQIRKAMGMRKARKELQQRCDEDIARRVPPSLRSRTERGEGGERKRVPGQCLRSGLRSIAW